MFSKTKKRCCFIVLQISLVFGLIEDSWILVFASIFNLFW